MVKRLMLGDASEETAGTHVRYTESSARAIGAEVADEPLPNRTIGSLVKLGCPRENLERAYVLIGKVIDEMRLMIVDEREDLTGHAEAYNAEKVSIMFGRWVKLHRDFYSKKRGFDLSKVPDLYDCVKFDAIHNSRIKLPSVPELFYIAKRLADFVIPQEYGVTQDQKVASSRLIGQTMFRVMAHHLQWARRDAIGAGGPPAGGVGSVGEHDTGQASMAPGDGDGLGEDVAGDAARTREGTQLDTSYHTAGDSLMQGLLTPDRQVRTRIFVTSESHVHALLNVLRYATTRDGSPLLPEEARKHLDAAPELNFLTHFIFKVFERRSDGALRVQVQFSAGANENPMDFYHRDQDHSAVDLSPDKSAAAAAGGKRAPAPETEDFDAVSTEIKAACAALSHPDGRLGGAELKASIAASKPAQEPEPEAPQPEPERFRPPVRQWSAEGNDLREMDLLEVPDSPRASIDTSLAPSVVTPSGSQRAVTAITDALSALSMSMAKNLHDRIDVDDLCYALHPSGPAPCSPPREKGPGGVGACSPRGEPVTYPVGS